MPTDDRPTSADDRFDELAQLSALLRPVRQAAGDF